MSYPHKKIDRDVDAAYFRYSDSRVAETVELDAFGLEDYIVDLDADGEVIGLEVLNYSDHATELDAHPDVWTHLKQNMKIHLH